MAARERLAPLAASALLGALCACGGNAGNSDDTTSGAGGTVPPSSDALSEAHSEDALNTPSRESLAEPQTDGDMNAPTGEPLTEARSENDEEAQTSELPAELDAFSLSTQGGYVGPSQPDAECDAFRHLNMLRVERVSRSLSWDVCQRGALARGSRSLDDAELTSVMSALPASAPVDRRCGTDAPIGLLDMETPDGVEHYAIASTVCFFTAFQDLPAVSDADFFDLFDTLRALGPSRRAP